MRSWRFVHLTAMLAAGLCIGTIAAQASPFVVFPKASELISPDARYAVRNVDPAESKSDFVGTFHALWVFELATGRSRKLCDYMGVASAAWSSNDLLVVNQYVGRRTSRVLVFSAAAAEDPVMLDKTTLTQLVPSELRPALRENDHLFIEGSRVEQDFLHLTVWGYGQHDPNGFRYRCEYGLREGNIACIEDRGSH
jgi:hypothetical protein